MPCQLSLMMWLRCSKACMMPMCGRFYMSREKSGRHTFRLPVKQTVNSAG